MNNFISILSFVHCIVAVNFLNVGLIRRLPLPLLLHNCRLTVVDSVELFNLFGAIAAFYIIKPYPTNPNHYKITL